MSSEKNESIHDQHLSAMELFANIVYAKLIEGGRRIGSFDIEKDNPIEVIKFFKEWVVSVRTGVEELEVALRSVVEIETVTRGLYLFEIALEQIEKGQKGVFTRQIDVKPAFRPKDPAAYGKLKDEVAKGYRLLRARGATQKEVVAGLNAVLSSGGLPVMTADAIRKRATKFKLENLETVGGFFVAPDKPRITFCPEQEMQGEQPDDWFQSEISAEEKKSLIETYALICLYQFLEKARFSIAK